MAELEPAVDAYGSAAPRSALADFVEISAVAGRRVNEQLLADYMDDAELTLLSGERYYEPAAGPIDRSADPDEVARAVFSLLEERSGILGERYPFELRRGRWRYLAEREGGPYLALLAITLAHAYDLGLTPNPTDVFPISATLGVQAIGLNAICLTEIRRTQTFAETVSQAGMQLQLHPMPQEGLRSVNVNDAGVDVLGAVAWGDRRVGAWAYIGQATCGSSDTWRRKVGEASPGSWVHYLNCGLRPLPFLAVPHHIEPRHFEWLTQETDALILDRLRLVAFRHSTTDDERALVNTVLAQPVASLY